MRHNIFVVALLISMVLHGVNCQTIDEIILLAQEHSSDSELFRDNKTVKVELDMLFDAEEYARMYQQDVEAEQSEREGRRSRKKRKAIRYEEKRWTNNVIPYTLRSGFSGPDQAQIQAAVNDWNSYTCINFRPYRSGDSNYVSIQGGGGCSSYVGMSGGSQPLTLGRGCRRKGIIAHEMGHALGFHHEQTRPDRDQYVQIFYQNIVRGMGYNFQRHSTSVINNYGVPYDYLSIMHYGKTAFTTNGQVTISTIDSTYQNIIGTRQTLSFKDVKLANLMYKCGSHCGNKKCTGDGFVGKDCKCYCSGNPTKLCSGGGGTGGEDKNCKDNNPNCPSWAALGECSADSNGRPASAWMLVHCKLSCKKCTGGGGTTTPRPTTGPGDKNCKDNFDTCPSYARLGDCATERVGRPTSAWMLVHCKLSCKKCTGGGGTGGGTTTPRPTPRPTPGPGDRNCKDNHGSCPSWASIGKCQDSGRTPPRAWMVVHCKLSCKVCTTGGGGGGPPTPAPTPAPTPQPTCTDKKQYCTYWTTQGHCTSAAYASYMRINCPASCKACTTRRDGGLPAPTPAPAPRPNPSPSCRDSSGSCPSWASSGECRRNPAYMLQYCKKSCRQC